MQMINESMTTTVNAAKREMMRIREKIQKQIEKEQALEEKRLAKEQAKMTKEFEKVDIDTEFDKQVKKGLGKETDIQYFL